MGDSASEGVGVMLRLLEELCNRLIGVQTP